MSEESNKRFTSQHPELGTAPVSTLPYYDPGFFKKEKEKIFSRCWINVGREEEIPATGDYFVRELKVCNTSILVVRGKDNVVRAFHNMCSHRGNPIAWEDRGNCPGLFVCRFHAWSFETTGELARINDEDRFFDVDKTSNGLAKVTLDSWQGFLFINLDANPSQSLAEYLGGVVEAVKGYPFNKLRYTYKYRAEENVNWKLLQEAQQEGWHVPYLHQKTLAKTAANPGQMFRHAAIKCYGPHSMVSSHAPDSYSPTPVAALSMKFGGGVYDAFANENDEEESMDWHGAFDLYHVFPNFFIGLLRGSYFTYNIWPQDVDRSTWEVRLYYPEPRNAGELFSLEYGKCGLRDTLREDAFTHEKIQSVIASGARRHFHLQDEELAVRNFNNAVTRYVND